MLYSMIVSQWHAHGHFSAIENELVSKLDGLFMSGAKGDDVSRAFFITQLRQLFESSAVDKELQVRVAGFMDSVDQFLELLLSVRALPDGEEYADDRVIATLRLMNFIRRIGRNEMYIKYVHQLVNVSIFRDVSRSLLTSETLVDASPGAELRRSRAHAQAACRLARVGP